MREPFRKLTLAFASLTALALLNAGAAVAQPARDVTVATDCWQTQTGTQHTIATIPAGFFGAGSQAIARATIRFKGKPLTPTEVTGPFPPNCACSADNLKITWLDRHGNAVGADRMVHAVTQVVTTSVDTCIRRTTAARLTPGRATPTRVSLHLVQLSLQSESPLEVAFKTGPSKKYDVFVTESAKQPHTDSHMILTPSHVDAHKASGKVKLGSLHFNYDVEFRPVGGGASLWMKDKALNLANTPGTFEALFP